MFSNTSLKLHSMDPSGNHVGVLPDHGALYLPPISNYDEVLVIRIVQSPGMEQPVIVQEEVYKGHSTVGRVG